jgi:F-box and WD-40 domain protein CDC4
MPSTLYIPIASPPTPAPSPGPFTDNHDHNLPLVRGFQQFAYDPTHDFSLLSGQARLDYLDKLIARCTPKELSHVSALISPLLRHNFLQELPTELALHVLSYVDDFHELVRGVGGVCKYWRRLSSEDCLWRRMCERWEFEVPLCLQDSEGVAVPGSAKRDFKTHYLQRKSAVFIFSFLPAPHTRSC